MKKTLAILLLVLAGCRKTAVEQSIIDTSKNPQLISVSVNGNVSEIVRVK